MADTLKVYKGGAVVGSAERQADGKASVKIDGLTADTDYPTGTYQVSFSNGSGESAKVDVPSFKTKPILVTGVTLDKSTLSLEEGSTGNLVATVAPSNASYKAVSFTSSDNAIATVDGDGLVTAVAAGSADITVESIADGSKTAKCTLTVTAKQIPVTGVTLTPKTVNVDVDATTKLNSTVAPSTATNKSVSYKSSDEAIATVSSDGTVTGVTAGSATITVTTQEGSKKDTTAVTVNALPEPEPEPEPEV